MSPLLAKVVFADIKNFSYLCVKDDRRCTERLSGHFFVMYILLLREIIIGFGVFLVGFREKTIGFKEIFEANRKFSVANCCDDVTWTNIFGGVC